ncbi:MAG TPA: hypothetical protein VFG63_00885, partial [Nocardioidaceae bacterium]|nr:hypothetical protein [Nocardioidaceae bacterium]
MPKLDTRWPFTRHQALSAGIPAGALRGPRYTQLFRGIYIQSRVPFHAEIRTRAALLAHPPRAFASYHSAAKQYHLPVP